jgi:hypothetical protein
VYSIRIILSTLGPVLAIASRDTEINELNEKVEGMLGVARDGSSKN